MTPFTHRRSESVACKGEAFLIAAVRKWLGPAAPNPPGGPGDDCAVLSTSSGKSLLVTTDPIVWQTHFDETVTAGEAARKLIRRNLSDIAAMGGKPLSAVVSWAIPPNTSMRWLADFHRALARDAKKFGVAIVGGDVSSTASDLSAHLTLIGEAGPRPLLRSGASCGDRIYVTGTLGGSILGKHVRFEPRLAEGRWLAARSGVSCLIDLSDGLAKELPLITPPGSAAHLDLRSVPISSAARRLSKQTRRPVLEHAMTDGEDFELLFAISGGENARRIESGWRKRFETRLTRIGEFVPDSTAARSGGLNELKGFEHFSSTPRKPSRK